MDSFNRYKRKEWLLTGQYTYYITLENTEGALKNGESRETGNIDEEKQKHNIICVGHHYTQITLISHEPSYKQVEIKTNRRSFLCGNRNGYHNTKLRT
jgi:hypothetical protein